MKQGLVLWILFFTCVMHAQKNLDSLYALLKVQSVASIIHVIDSGFITIGHGTDTVPFNAYGTLVTKFDFDGEIQYSKFTLDSNQLRQFWDINLVVIDSFIYTIPNGSNPDVLLKINMFNGKIVERREYENMAGDERTSTFAGSIHRIDTATLLLNVIGYAPNARHVTQFCIYDIKQDTFIYLFNDYPGYNQRITNLLVTDAGYVLTGTVYKNNPGGPNYQSMATVVWLDRAFQETKRYLSPDDHYEGWGKDLLKEGDGSLILTNCIARQYKISGPFYTYTYRPTVYKLSSEGELLWQTHLGRDIYFDVHFGLSSLVRSNLGDGFIAAGSQTNFTDSLYYGTQDSVNELGENLRFEALIAKVSNEGDSLWSRSYYTADFPFSRAGFNDMIPHPDGGYLICGSANKHPIVPDLPASYSWILHVDEYGCAVPGCHEIVKSEDPGLPDPIRFYPNPAMESIYLYQQEEECIDYAIHDMQGKLMHQHKTCQAGSTGIIDVSSYPPGSYVLTKKDELGRVRSDVWVKQ